MCSLDQQCDAAQCWALLKQLHTCPRAAQTGGVCLLLVGCERVWPARTAPSASTRVACMLHQAHMPQPRTRDLQIKLASRLSVSELTLVLVLMSWCCPNPTALLSMLHPCQCTSACRGLGSPTQLSKALRCRTVYRLARWYERRWTAACVPAPHARRAARRGPPVPCSGWGPANSRPTACQVGHRDSSAQPTGQHALTEPCRCPGVFNHKASACGAPLVFYRLPVSGPGDLPGEQHNLLPALRLE